MVGLKRGPFMSFEQKPMMVKDIIMIIFLVIYKIADQIYIRVSLVQIKMMKKLKLIWISVMTLQSNNFIH